MRKAWRWAKRVGLALLLAAAVLCVASEFYFVSLSVTHRSGSYCGAMFSRHMLIVSRGTDGVFDPLRFTTDEGDWKIEHQFVTIGTNWGLRRQWTPSYTPAGSAPDMHTHQIGVPLYWVPLVVVSLFVVRLLRRRPVAERCAGCHYDLRGLPKDAAVCPECGAGIAGVKSAGGEA